MLPFRSGCPGSWGFAVWSSLVLSLSMVVSTGPVFGKSKQQKKPKPNLPTASPSASTGEQNLTNIPLPVGHEAKGLVLPDFDLEGHLRGRFEAESAKRLDEVHIGFHT